jgi:hypothetical protein
MIKAIVPFSGLRAVTSRSRNHLLMFLCGLLLHQVAVRADAPVPDMPFVNSLGMKFVPAGTDGVLFSIWDVRVKDFQAFVDATSPDMHGSIFALHNGIWNRYYEYSWFNPGFAQTDSNPVLGVDGVDAQKFLDWLNEKEHTAGTLKPTLEYRLPTKIEWSKAAGATIYPWGDVWPPPAGAGNFAGTEAQNSDWTPSDPIIAGYNDGFPRTSPVGSFRANSYGLYDREAMSVKSAAIQMENGFCVGRDGTIFNRQNCLLVTSWAWVIPFVPSTSAFVPFSPRRPRRRRRRHLPIRPPLRRHRPHQTHPPRRLYLPPKLPRSC